MNERQKVLAAVADIRKILTTIEANYIYGREIFDLHMLHPKQDKFALLEERISRLEENVKC